MEDKNSEKRIADIGTLIVIGIIIIGILIYHYKKTQVLPNIKLKLLEK